MVSETAFPACNGNGIGKSVNLARAVRIAGDGGQGGRHLANKKGVSGLGTDGSGGAGRSGGMGAGGTGMMNPMMGALLT